MSTILGKIKSKYLIQNLFGFLPYNLTLKLIYGSRKLSSDLSINKENYKKFYEIKKILKPSYDIEKYFTYFDIKNNNKNSLNYNDINNMEKVLYGCLNNAPFNINMFLEKEGWEYIITNIKKVKLIITPNMLKYINNTLDIKAKQNIFDIMNKYKNNIVEISFSLFINEAKLNFENINKIINFLQNIFENKNWDKNSYSEKNNINSIIMNENNNNNCNHCVKKLIFEKNEISPYIDITSKFFDKIDNILSLKIIEGISIDSTPYNEYQFSDLMKYISKKMISLKYLKINDFGSVNNHYVDFNILCTNPNEKIEIIDLSNSFCLSSILPLLNLKKHSLKELKLKIISNKSNDDWDFLTKNINTLEIFEIEIKENKSEKFINYMISLLNKMKKLKSLKIKTDLRPNQIINFKNRKNLEHFDINLDLNDKNIELYNYSMYSYFKSFEQLKSLTIEIKEKNKSIKNQNIPNLSLPLQLNSLSLTNIEGKYLISLFKGNEKEITNIEELKIDNSNFKNEDFQSLVNLFISFKSLKKLSLNRIKEINCFSDSESMLYNNMPIILKNIPNLIEMDISNNNYKESILKSKIFEIIRLSLPKKLLSLKIFNSDIPISHKTFNYLVESFGFVLDFDGNYPKIDTALDFISFIDDDENYFDDDIFIDIENDSELDHVEYQSFGVDNSYSSEL